MSDPHDKNDDEYWVHTHIAEVKEYLKVLGTLLVLTACTVAIYPDADLWGISWGFDVRLGAANLGLAIVIATVKATLVCYFFMHMKYEKKFNVVFFVGSVVFGAVFFSYTSNDTAHRGVVDEYNGGAIDGRTGDRAAGGVLNCGGLEPPSLAVCSSNDECSFNERCNDGACHWPWPCSYEEFIATEAEEGEGLEAAEVSADSPGTGAVALR